MKRFFHLMRCNKQLLVVFIVAIIEFCFMVGVAIFDVVQLIQIKSNAVSVSSAFIGINLALIVVVSVSFLLVVSMFLIKLIKGKQKELKQD